MAFHRAKPQETSGIDASDVGGIRRRAGQSQQGQTGGLGSKYLMHLMEQGSSAPGQKKIRRDVGWSASSVSKSHASQPSRISNSESYQGMTTRRPHRENKHLHTSTAPCCNRSTLYHTRTQPVMIGTPLLPPHITTLQRLIRRGSGFYIHDSIDRFAGLIPHVGPRTACLPTALNRSLPRLETRSCPAWRCYIQGKRAPCWSTH
jgi:hypothetical protein